VQRVDPISDTINKIQVATGILRRIESYWVISAVYFYPTILGAHAQRLRTGWGRPRSFPASLITAAETRTDCRWRKQKAVPLDDATGQTGGQSETQGRELSIAPRDPQMNW